LHQGGARLSGLFFYSQAAWVKQQGRWEKKTMENKDAEYWIKKGDEFYNDKNYEEAIECYEKATQLNPNKASAFYNWGYALSELAKIKQDEGLFKEACEKYEKAEQLDPNDAIVFYYWGNTLSDLAESKLDEDLFKKSFEKYEKSTQLNPNYTNAFFNWGYALYNLAEIKPDEALFKEVCEKYDIAARLDPNDASVFYYWGYAILRLAEIKPDEALFKEACEKYGKATRLDKNDASAFYNWGLALYKLAEMKQDEYFRKNLETFESESKDIDDPDTLLIKGELYFALKRTEEVKECFIKSKKDILEILTFLDKKDREEIIKTKILHSLLEPISKNDGLFTRAMEKIKELKKTESYDMDLDEYKKIYILSTFIISLLHITDENEKLVAHYREKSVSQKLFFDSNSKFRLNAIDYSNDLDEGKTLLDFLYGKENRLSDEKLNNEEYEAFASCFVFDYDNLNLFRLYGKEDGKEGTGLSLVFKDSFFSKEAKMAFEKTKADMRKMKMSAESPKMASRIEEDKSSLYRCIYIDPETQHIVTIGQKEEYLFHREGIWNKFKDYNKKMEDIIERVKIEMEDLKKQAEKLDPAIVGQLLLNLRYLVKHVAFKEEQECRIVKILKLDDKDIKHTEEYKQLYIEYPPKVSEHIDRIYFGPKAVGLELFKSILKNKKLNIRCEKSTNPLA
jgi:tetratricopeptide (TPR) repeat protein